MFHRVLYQRFTPPGRQVAFSYIDDGFIAAWRNAGARVYDWFEPHGPPLADVLADFRPTLFLGALQQTRREPAVWTQPDGLRALVRYRQDQRLFVACRSSPSDMPDVSARLGLPFHQYPDGGVASFYEQCRRPSGTEHDVLAAGAIDLIRSPLAAECYPLAFRTFLELGLPVLEELHAADAERYAPIDTEKRIDVSFIGGCWPFKWANMGPFVLALHEALGERLRIWGKGWPDGVSLGPLEGDDAYRQVIAESRVCLALHEPSQVLDTPFGTNERPFKLLAMGACVVCDANPMIMSRFRDAEHLRFAASPARMVEIVTELLGDPGERDRLGAAGRAHVLARHTYASRVERLTDLVASGVQNGRIYASPEGMKQDAA